MDPDYGRSYRELYERHWWWRAREAALLETIAARRPAGGWQRILDVGCGDGLFFDRLIEFGEVEGVEPAEDLVNPRGVHRHRIHVAPFDERFRPPHRYSLILMLDMLEHCDDPVAVLRHALHLLAPDGTIIITVPAFMTLWTNHDVVNHHHMRYTKATFRRLAREAGLRIDDERYWFHWTFPAKLVERIAERLRQNTPALPRVPPPWINRPLYFWSRLERRLLEPLRLPFGSSLLVIGGERRASAV
jgi:2-polyprenyl-3-methyl-5-hydroxy-6-metoxy-1,4-benzoquinol methylase